MTKDEVKTLMTQLQLVFDFVRLVDVSTNTQYLYDDDGELKEQPYRCYSLWKKTQRCENCIAAKAFHKKARLTKFEFVEDDVYHVIAMYMEIEQIPYVLEMVSKIRDDSIIQAYGKTEFVKTINYYNHKLYKDALTGAYNRRYFEEQLIGLTSCYTLAMTDLDNFKQINDQYGHAAGDCALRQTAMTLSEHLSAQDIVIRYGGDEFLIVLQDLSPKDLKQKLEMIRTSVQAIHLAAYPDIHLSVSIGSVSRMESIEHALEEADRMLYQAKKQKNTAVLYERSESKGMPI